MSSFSDKHLYQKNNSIELFSIIHEVENTGLFLKRFNEDILKVKNTYQNLMVIKVFINEVYIITLCGNISTHCLPNKSLIKTWNHVYSTYKEKVNFFW